MTQFSDFALRPEIQQALATQGYTTPTPIQMKAIPVALEGRDVMGIAQTGTGKTAAFALPMLNKLANYLGQVRRPGLPKALILAPTRELAVQIGDSCRAYAGSMNLRYATILGGVSQLRQEDMLQRGVDFVIATPGRLLDLLEQRILSLSSIEILVLDEADRMLDMGFINDIRRIMAMLPKERQTMFFSATMSRDVSDLAHKLLNDPVRVEVAPESTTAEKVEQHVILANGPEKRQILVDLLAMPEMSRVIIFTRTKHGADKVAILLERAGITTGALHGRKSQNARQGILRSFASGKIRALVATDIASRGIDVDDVSHVINYELPNEPEIYVHRIGRTARAGKAGIAISLCAGDETAYLRQIEKLTRQRVPVANRPAASAYKVPPKAEQPPRTEEQSYGGRPQGRGGPQRANRNLPRGRFPREENNWGPSAESDRGVPRAQRPRSDAPSSGRPQHSARPDHQHQPRGRQEGQRPANGNYQPQGQAKRRYGNGGGGAGRGGYAGPRRGER